MSPHPVLSLAASAPFTLSIMEASTPMLAGAAVVGLIAVVVLLRIAVAIAIRVGFVLAVALGVLYVLSELGADVPVFALGL